MAPGKQARAAGGRAAMTGREAKAGDACPDSEKKKLCPPPNANTLLLNTQLLRGAAVCSCASPFLQ